MFRDVPAFEGHYTLPHGIEHKGQVHSAFVTGQGIQPADGYAEILAQKFKQGYIHLGLFVPYTQHIAFFLYLLYKIHRDQDYWRIAWLFAFIGLVPFEEAKGKIKGICSVFLKAYFRLAVELFHGLFKLALFQEGAKAVLFKLGLGNYSESVGIRVLHFKGLCIGSFKGHILRQGKDPHFAACAYGIFKGGQVGGDKLYHRCAWTEVQKGIAKAQVKELSFPHTLAGDLFALVGNLPRKGQVDILGGGGQIFTFALSKVVCSCTLCHYRDRAQAVATAACDIHRHFKLTGLIHIGASSGFCIFKIHCSSCGEGGTLNKADLVDALCHSL